MREMAFDNVLAGEIWSSKYRYAAGEGQGDRSVEETWARVAAAVAEAEPAAMRATRRAEFQNALQGFRFLPAGRILAGAGTGRSASLFNCFVMGGIPDGLSGVFLQM